MQEPKIFVSVGVTANESQEAFVRAVEDRLRAEGLSPHTVGRNTFSADAPLKTVTELLDQCSGTVIIALERIYFPKGVEKRGGPKEAPLHQVKLSTPWNQIEAAMAYSRGHPLMVIVEKGIKSEGLLQSGYDWWVQSVDPVFGALNSPEFNGVLSSWKQKLLQCSADAKSNKNPSDLTIGELISNMKPSQLWAVLGGIAALAAGSFALGAALAPLGKVFTH